MLLLYRYSDSKNPYEVKDAYDLARRAGRPRTHLLGIQPNLEWYQLGRLLDNDVDERDFPVNPYTDAHFTKYEIFQLLEYVVVRKVCTFATDADLEQIALNWRFILSEKSIKRAFKDIDREIPNTIGLLSRQRTTEITEQGMLNFLQKLLEAATSTRKQHMHTIWVYWLRIFIRTVNINVTSKNSPLYRYLCYHLVDFFTCVVSILNKSALKAAQVFDSYLLDGITYRRETPLFEDTDALQMTFQHVFGMMKIHRDLHYATHNFDIQGIFLLTISHNNHDKISPSLWLDYLCYQMLDAQYLTQREDINGFVYNFSIIYNSIDFDEVTYQPPVSKDSILACVMYFYAISAEDVFLDFFNRVYGSVVIGNEKDDDDDEDVKPWYLKQRVINDNDVLSEKLLKYVFGDLSKTSLLRVFLEGRGHELTEIDITRYRGDTEWMKEAVTNCSEREYVEFLNCVFNEKLIKSLGTSNRLIWLCKWLIFDCRILAIRRTPGAVAWLSGCFPAIIFPMISVLTIGDSEVVFNQVIVEMLADIVLNKRHIRDITFQMFTIADRQKTAQVLILYATCAMDMLLYSGTVLKDLKTVEIQTAFADFFFVLMDSWGYIDESDRYDALLCLSKFVIYLIRALAEGRNFERITYDEPYFEEFVASIMEQNIDNGKTVAAQLFQRYKVTLNDFKTFVYLFRRASTNYQLQLDNNEEEEDTNFRRRSRDDDNNN